MTRARENLLVVVIIWLGFAGVWQSLDFARHGIVAAIDFMECEPCKPCLTEQERVLIGDRFKIEDPNDAG
jgi:hypothetical protein